MYIYNHVIIPSALSTVAVDCIDLVVWVSSSNNRSEVINLIIIVGTRYFKYRMLFTVQSPCDAGLTGVMENLYKRVEFDVVSIHCSL